MWSSKPDQRCTNCGSGGGLQSAFLLGEAAEKQGEKGRKQPNDDSTPTAPWAALKAFSDALCLLLPAAPLGSRLGTHHPFTNEWSAQGQEATQGLDSSLLNFGSGFTLVLQNQVTGWRDRKGRISLFAFPDAQS